jgi:CRISPR-associated protein Csm5
LFEGASDDREFYQTPEVLQSLHWKSALTRRRLLQSANQYARTLLQAHRQFATMTGLTPLLRTIEALEQRLGIAEQQGNACMLVLGWGTGLFGKVGFPKFDDPAYRDLLADSPHYGRAIRSGMPFPKTRRIVFMGNQPAALPGWCWLEVN